MCVPLHNTQAHTRVLTHWEQVYELACDASDVLQHVEEPAELRREMRALVERCFDAARTNNGPSSDREQEWFARLQFLVYACEWIDDDEGHASTTDGAEGAGDVESAR